MPILDEGKGLELRPQHTDDVWFVGANWPQQATFTYLVLRDRASGPNIDWVSATKLGFRATFRHIWPLPHLEAVTVLNTFARQSVAKPLGEHPEGSLAGNFWVGFWGLGGPWEL